MVLVHLPRVTRYHFFRAEYAQAFRRLLARRLRNHAWRRAGGSVGGSKDLSEAKFSFPRTLSVGASGLQRAG